MALRARAEKRHRLPGRGRWLIVVPVLLPIAGALLAAELFRRAVLESYGAVARACGLDIATFQEEQADVRSVAEVAAAHGVDAEAVIYQWMTTSKFRWVRWVRSRVD